MRVLERDQEACPHGLVPSFFLRPVAPAPRRKGNRGLANEFPDQISASPRKTKDIDNTPLTERYGWRELRRGQSSRRICVEHATSGIGSGFGIPHSSGIARPSTAVTTPCNPHP